MQIHYHFTQDRPDMGCRIGADAESSHTQAADGGAHVWQHRFDTHCLGLRSASITLWGKAQHHTQIDLHGTILCDSAVIIDRIVYDDIDVTAVYCQGRQCYQHDHNGATAMVLDEFYGYMGQNGTVLLEFTLPIWQWFLEHSA